MIITTRKIILTSKISRWSARTRNSTTTQTLPCAIMSTMNRSPSPSARDSNNLIKTASTTRIAVIRWSARTRNSTTTQTPPCAIISIIVRISCRQTINQIVIRNRNLMVDPLRELITLAVKNKIPFLRKNRKELVYTRKNMVWCDLFTAKSHFYTLD